MGVVIANVRAQAPREKEAATLLLWAEAMARRVRLLLVLASERVEKRVYGKAQTEDHNDNGDGERSGGEMEDGSPARTRIHSSSMSTVVHSTARSLPAWPLLSAESKGTLRLVDWASRPGQFSFSTLRQPPHRSPRRHRDFCSTPRRKPRRRHPHHRLQQHWTGRHATLATRVTRLPLYTASALCFPTTRQRRALRPTRSRVAHGSMSCSTVSTPTKTLPNALARCADSCGRSGAIAYAAARQAHPGQTRSVRRREQRSVEAIVSMMLTLSPLPLRVRRR